VVSVVLLLILSSLAEAAPVAAPADPSSTANVANSPIPLAPGSDFSTYLGNIERTSSSSSEQLINVTTAPSLHLLWSYNSGKAIESQPVEQNGTVYFGGKSGYEYAIDATDGKLLWKTFLGQASNDSACGSAPLGVTSTATVDGSTLYVDGGYPDFYALNSSTGAIEWRAPIGGTNLQGFYDWSSPLIYNDSAYVGIASECDEPLVPAGVVEYSLASHTSVGYFNSSSPASNGSSIWGSPSVNPTTNTIFVTTGNQYGNTPATLYSESVLALNATTLTVQAKWQVPKKQAIGDSDFGVTPTLFTPTGGYPMVTAANKNGYLYAFYQSNLTLAWEEIICCHVRNSSEDEHISTAWGGGLVYAVSSITAIGGVTYNSSVLALNPLTGAIVWAKGLSQVSFNGYAAPLYVNNLLLVADQGTLLAFNATTGTIVYDHTLPGAFVAAPSISRGEIFVGSNDGDAYAFDLVLNSSANQSRASGVAPLSDALSVTGAGGLPPYSYVWKFGDGGTSDLQDPSHTFASIGTYNVSVIVKDLAGNVSTVHLTTVVSQGFNVTFTESRLPTKTNWSVVMGNVLQSSTKSKIAFTEPNGTYAYSVESVIGFSPSPSMGSITVNGTNQSVSVTFASEYSVTFTENGLPPGVPWNVTIGSVTVTSTMHTIVFLEPNGTYAFRLGTVPGWETLDTGSVVVTGSNRSVVRTFTQPTHLLTFKEAGLPSGTSWSVTIGAKTVNSTTAKIWFYLPNGTYSYSVSNVTGYSRTATGTFTIDGVALTVITRFTYLTYLVTMREIGLPRGTSWSVTIGAKTLNSTTAKIWFYLPNGTYGYYASALDSDYQAHPGNVTTQGAELVVNVTFVQEDAISHLTRGLYQLPGGYAPVATTPRLNPCVSEVPYCTSNLGPTVWATSLRSLES
jgi:outer membrane protein assembly factor BamB